MIDSFEPRVRGQSQPRSAWHLQSSVLVTPLLLRLWGGVGMEGDASGQGAGFFPGLCPGQALARELDPLSITTGLGGRARHRPLLERFWQGY